MIDIDILKNKVVARKLQIFDLFLRKKRRTAVERILILIDIAMIILGSLLVPLNMTNIILQSYYFLIY